MHRWRKRLEQLSVYMHTRRFWTVLFGIALMAGLGFYLLYVVFRQDPASPDLATLITRVDPAMFLTSSLVYLGCLTLAVGGWIWIIGTLSGHWQWFQHFRIFCMMNVTRRIPGMVWYLFGRMVMYERLQVPRSLTAVASGLEFATILLGGFLVTLVTWPVALSQYNVSPLWFIAGLLLGGVLLNPYTLRRAIRRINPQSDTLDLRYRHLCGWVLLYAGVWAGGGVLLFVLTHTIHTMPLTMVPAIIGIWATTGVVATLLSFVPLGLGQELTLTALLSLFVGTPEAIVIAFLMRGVLTLNEVAWALIASLFSLRDLVDCIRSKRQRRSLPIDADASGRVNGQKPEEVYDRTAILPHK
jgi:hypothetical protein